MAYKETYIYMPKIHSLFSAKWRKSNISYYQFIQLLNLGVQPEIIDYSCNDELKSLVYTNHYKITNSKKWILTKLKYGF